MILCAGGDIHGALDRFDEDLLAFESAVGVRFEVVLHVGDFGVWPDPERIDRATRDHEGAGDFPAWFAAGRAVPRPTVFIKGNHEDFAWLDERKGKEVLPGLTFLPNGHAIDIGEGRDSIRVGGLGGCYGPSDYERQARHLQGYARRHYTRDEVERLCARLPGRRVRQRSLPARGAGGRPRRAHHHRRRRHQRLLARLAADGDQQGAARRGRGRAARD